MDSHATYDQYFDVNEKYFPCIDDSAIKGGARWDDTYPHQEFIKLLRAAENMLSGSTNRSIWIHGAYGTGKSKCAYALKKILEVPQDELEEYWNNFDSLKKESDLLTKLEGHRDRGIVTVYRYATGGITSPEKLFFAIQESIRKAIDTNDRVSYKGENTLKENVIAWIEEPSHKRFFEDLLNKPEWAARFPQSTADEVLNSLKKSSDIKDLMSNIFDLADKEGITAMTLDADRLKDWIRDIIKQNHIKIVFFWDEFSKFFENNKYSLDEFQKIVSICQEVPFYLVIVTHRTSSIINDQDESWKIVQQRFDQVEITLPNNIAFELIGQAFKPKPAALEQWNKIAETLNSRLDASRTAVMKAANINNPKVIKDIMPIHPMAALVLKNIAEAFASNQRSMFDFIKVKDDSQAFQWFISHYGPKDSHPLLTIDMLWDFFYEKGKDNLSPDIRMILDTYPQQKELREDEKRVLKTVLIMQAIDKRLSGAIEVLRPTDQNLSYAFEGITSGLDTSCKNIAKALVSRGILVQNPIGNNKYAYGVAVLAGDQARIDELKASVRRNSTTAKLVDEGGLDSSLSLSPALRLRFSEAPDKESITTVTINDFTKKINALKDRTQDWHFNAVIAFAKDENEGNSLREEIKKAAANPDYREIIFIDATSTPLGDDDFDSYVEYSALAAYYQNNNLKSAKDNNKLASNVLSIGWKNRIYSGKFVIYSFEQPDGVAVIGGAAVADELKAYVLRKYKYIPDFMPGLTESQFKITSTIKASALCGINEKTGGVVAGVEKTLLKAVWCKEKYWEDPALSNNPIVAIKKEVDQFVNQKFEEGTPVSITEIFELLQKKFGYARSNLSAFLMGFLLKEFSSSQIRYLDQNGAPGEMSPEKLSEMIGNCIKSDVQTYLVKMTPDERAFYELTSVAWEIDKNLMSSPAKAAALVKKRMQHLGLPVWCLADLDQEGIYDAVKQYILLVQKEGKDEHEIANTIGKAARNNPGLAEKLKEFLTITNCREGMIKFLGHFENGKLIDLTNEIGATKDDLLNDITNLFSVEYSSFWNKETGEDQIRRLITDYEYVEITNSILQASAHSKKDADNAWKEKVEFIICSCESLQDKYPDMDKTFEFLREISSGKEILPERMKNYVEDLSSHSRALKDYLDDQTKAFAEIYAPYLEGLNEHDISELEGPELLGVFNKSRTESNTVVKKIADEFRKNQTKSKLASFWREKTNTKSPKEWSLFHRTPIMLMVQKDNYDSAKKTFELINSGVGTEEDFENALEFLQDSDILDSLNNSEKVDNAFRLLLGSYSGLLGDLGKVRDSLQTLQVEPYEWDTHPSVKEKIEELARAEYDAGGSDRVINLINNMDDQSLRNELIKIVKKDIQVGIGILDGGR